MEAALIGTGHQAFLNRALQRVVDGGEWSMEVYWNPVARSPVTNAGSVQYVMNKQNPDKLIVEGLACFRLYTGLARMPPMEGPRTGRMVETFKDVVKAVRPRFALLDHHQEVIRKRKGQDPRRFAWGATYYDADHVAAIGLDRLRNCTAIIKEEWPDDESFWLQTWANPFVVASQLTDQISQQLALPNARLPTFKSAKPSTR